MQERSLHPLTTDAVLETLASRWHCCCRLTNEPAELQYREGCWFTQHAARGDAVFGAAKLTRRKTSFRCVQDHALSAQRGPTLRVRRKGALSSAEAQEISRRAKVLHIRLSPYMPGGAKAAKRAVPDE